MLAVTKIQFKKFTSIKYIIIEHFFHASPLWNLSDVKRFTKSFKHNSALKEN